jgi:ketosteroid isomerase-like protein
MVPDHPNAERVRALFAAFHSRDLATIQQVIPDHAVWHFPGRHGQIAGSHRGRDAILGFLLKVQALTEGTFHLDLIDVIANDARAVALFRGHGQRNGKTLDNPTCLVMSMRGGSVAEVWEYVWDLYHVDEFWT